jgi:hypothetical protein
MYEYKDIQHRAILTHAVLAGLTPLIPIPFLDDWAKTIFLRRMARVVTGARGITLTAQEIDALIQENFMDSCIEGCLMIVLRLLREVFSKIFFWVEWRRAFNTVAITYYTGFLIDAALMDGALSGPPGPERMAEVVRLREAVRRARSGANPTLIKGLIRPRQMLSAGWTMVRTAVAKLPRMIAAIPGAVWQSIRATPGAVARGVGSFPRRLRENFYLRVQVLLGREKAPEIRAAERVVQGMFDALVNLDPAPFDALHRALVGEMKGI